MVRLQLDDRKWAKITCAESERESFRLAWRDWLLKLAACEIVKLIGRYLGVWGRPLG